MRAGATGRCDGGLDLAQPVTPGSARGQDLPERQSCPEADPAARALIALLPCRDSSTTAAERSGISRGSDLSSLNTAVKVLIGLPKADDATGLANSKWAGRAMSG